MRLSIEKQIFICRNDGILTTEQMVLKIQEPRATIREELEILKANGLYEQYRKLSDEEVATKTNTATPLQYKMKAEEILQKYKFRKGIVGYECWKELIALLLYQPKYRKESLVKVIYPIIAIKCQMKTENPIVVANALSSSLKEIQLDGQTVSTFLEIIGIALERQKTGKKEEKKETEKETPEIKTKKERPLEAETEEMGKIEDTYVKIPLKTLLEYYYLKGYFEGEGKHEIQIKEKTDKTWTELENLYRKDKLEGK